MAALITICVPTHRRPTLLLQTVLSCFAQDYRPLEIDIGDDSPDDQSENLVKALSVPEGITVRYWRNRPSLGQAGNVNRLFANARGDRLVLMHDDDLLLPNAISTMARAWATVPDVVAVYGMQQILNDSGELDLTETEFKALYYKRDRAHVGIQRNLLISALWRQFPNNGYLIETRAAQNAGYRSFEEVGHACDTDFSIRLALTARGRSFYMVDQFISAYRYNLNSLSRSVDVTWKFYEYLLTFDALDPAETEARDSLLREIAAQATKENALNGRRRAALKILFSRFYPHDQLLIKSFYHFGLTISPRLYRLRLLTRLLPFDLLDSPDKRILALARASRTVTSNGSQASDFLSASSVKHEDLALTITIVSQYVRYGHGQGRANLELVREALRQGHTMNIVASEIDSNICRQPNVRVFQLDVRKVPTQLLRDAIFEWRAQRVVRRLRGHSDIVHVNGAVVTGPSDVNTVHFVHGSHAKFQSGWLNFARSPYQLYQFIYTALNTVMERRSFHQAKAIVAVSHAVASDLVELGFDRRKVFVIYNGIDLEEFSPGYEERRRLSLPDNVVLGVFVGDIKNSRKNLDTVLRAMVKNTDLHLAVLADFAGTSAPALAAELGVLQRVHFLGERTDVAAVMRAADMLIFPSRYEPFGMVILEALASALPVIASRAAGASELVSENSGILIDDPNSVTELSEAIARLMPDPLLRAQMGRRGRAIAEHYSWQDMARQYITRYERVLGYSRDSSDFAHSSSPKVLAPTHHDAG